MVHCAVPGCSNDSRLVKKELAVSYHRIPHGSQYAWLNIIGYNKENVSSDLRVCSDHFKLDDFENPHSSSRRTLKPGVEPSLNLPLPKHDINIPSTSKIVAEAEPLRSVENIVLGKRRHSFSESVSKAEDEKTDSSSSSGERKRRLIKFMHSYSKSPEHFKKVMNTEKHKVSVYKSRYHAARRSNIRKSRKLIHLKQILAPLKKKFSLSGNAVNCLEDSISGVPLAIMRRMLKNQNKRSSASFPQEIKSFAMTLQFYSPRAYEYTRKTFCKALPAQSTIRRWLSKVECTPGYSEPSLKMLRLKAEEHFAKYQKKLLCSMIIDEMSIKKEIVVDHHSMSVWGYVDVGSNEKHKVYQQEATESFVIMVVGINCHFKLPVAYFLIDNLNSQEKANIVREALKILNIPHLQVISLTCDGPNTNIKMLELLGCDFGQIDNLKTYFGYPGIPEQRVYAILDACHMLKLWRNNWATLGCFFDVSGREIKWDYVRRLYEIQNEEGFLLANKLRKAHIEWRKNVMKVRYAAQVFSASVADALKFLKYDLHLEQFENVDATVQFIEMIDKLFDIQNSRNPFARGMKTPLKPQNEVYWRPFVEESIELLMTLKSSNGRYLHRTQNKTPVLGFLVNLKSLLHMYNFYVKENNYLKYVLTYKFSQDHLELFFCSIRSRNGWNNNPNAVQFARTYKRLLVHKDLIDNAGNCCAQDQTSTLTMSEFGVPIQFSDIKKRKCADEQISVLEEKLHMISPIILNEFKENVVAYISGYVIKMLGKTVHCGRCFNALISLDDSSRDVKLILRKSRGGLILPSVSLKKVCQKVENKIQILYRLCNQLPPGDILISLLLKDVPVYLNDSNIFPDLEDHIFDIAFEETMHKKILLESIIKCYSKIRLHSIARRLNEDISGPKIRHQLSKLILFKHQ